MHRRTVTRPRRIRPWVALGVIVALGAGGAIAAGAPASANGYGGMPDRLRGPLFDHAAKLAGFAERSWYLDNIPFVDLPDTGRADTGKQIEDVYYYRWSVNKRQLRYADPDRGYYLGLRIDTPGGNGPNFYQDLRWMRTRGIVENDLRRRTDALPLRYPDPVAYNVLAYAEATGDLAPVRAALPDLVRHWRSLDPYYDANVGLYWHQPVWDATEHSLAGAKVDFKVPQDVDFATPEPFLVPGDSFFGGWGYSAVLNSYQAVDARAIARIAQLTGDSATASDFGGRADALVAGMEKTLWDPQRGFYYHVMKDNAWQGYPFPEGTKLSGREVFGYVPWQLGLAPDDAQHAAAWTALTDPQGFGTAAGPPTSEVRDPDTDLAGGYDTSLFDNNCCRWHGPNWPFSTARMLQGMANALDDYRALTPTGASRPAVTREGYLTSLQRFATLQYKNGHPYVAEAADPVSGKWIYDEPGFSNHYNHYPYVDLVLTGLLGIRPDLGRTLTLNPLVPRSWDHFALEDLPYHGHRLTVVYDRTGSHYRIGRGLGVYLDGKRVGAATSPGKLAVRLPATLPGASDLGTPTRANWAANESNTNVEFTTATPSFPAASASYPGHDYKVHTGAPESRFVGVHKNGPSRRNESPNVVNSGYTLYDRDLAYAKWSTVGSPNRSDWVAVDFGQARPVDELRLALYTDDSIRVPRSVQLQWWDGSAWRDFRVRSGPRGLAGNDVNRFTVKPVTTSKVRVVLPSGGPYGVSQLEAWGAYNPTPVVTNCPTASALHYEAEDGLINSATTIGATPACGGRAVGGIDTGAVYFLDDPSKAKPGDLSATRTGPLWQGFTERSYVEFRVTVPSSRSYTATLRYANGLTLQARDIVQVDGGDPVPIELSPTGGWSAVPGSIRTATVPLQLTAGTHVIRVSKDSGYAELDSLDLT